MLAWGQQFNDNAGTWLDEATGDDVPRRFDPIFSPLFAPVPRRCLIVYSAEKAVSQLNFKQPATDVVAADPRSLVVDVCGYSKTSPSGVDKGKWGVYFGPGSRRNAFGTLEAALPQTNFRAQIEAVSRALRTVRRIYAEEDRSLAEVRIRSDCDFLVNSMTTWLDEWIDNGGWTTDGKPVPNFAELQGIHESMGDCEDSGMQVQFWLVSHEDTKPAVEATHLAVGEMADLFVREEGTGDERVETSSDESMDVSDEAETSSVEARGERSEDESDDDG
jgi:ribonuclease HI